VSLIDRIWLEAELRARGRIRSVPRLVETLIVSLERTGRRLPPHQRTRLKDELRTLLTREPRRAG